MGFCCIKWCGKSSKTSSHNKDGITFHRFPKTPAIKSKWIDATRREDWYPSSTSVICSKHFTADNFHQITGQRRRLLNSAVPTLYLPVLAPLPTTTDSKEVNHTVKVQEVVNEVPSTRTHLSPLPTGMDSDDYTIEIKEEVVDEVPSTSTHLIDDLTRQNSYPVVDPIPQDIDYDEGTSKKQDHDSTRQGSMLITTSQQQNTVLQTSTGTQNRSRIRDPDSPSAYDTPVEKRLCRRIMELKSKVHEKNVLLRKARDSNRRLKIKILKLESLVEELEKK